MADQFPLILDNSSFDENYHQTDYITQIFYLDNVHLI